MAYCDSVRYDMVAFSYTDGVQLHYLRYAHIPLVKEYEYNYILTNTPEGVPGHSLCATIAIRDI